VIDFERRFNGFDARVQRYFDRATLTAGVNIERLGEDRRGYENFVGSALGVMGRLRRDERNTSPRATPICRWRQTSLRAGSSRRRARLARGVRSEDLYLANGNDSGSVDMSSVNPVVGLVYRASSATSYYASYGAGSKRRR